MVVCDRDLTLVLRTLLVVGAVTSAAGVLEYAFVPTRWHIDIGIPRYFGEFLNLHYPNAWGLPTNYWQNVGDRVVRRAVSVYLSGQAFALPFLLLWPLCLLNLRTRWIRGGLLLVALNVVALFLTLTRMTIAVCFLQGLLLFWLIRRRYLVPYMAASAVVAALLVSGSEWIPLRTELPTAAVPETSVAIPQPRLVAEEKEQSGRVSFEALTLRQMASDTAQFRDSSSNVRLPQWVAGWQMLRAHPAGMGLGSTGNTAGRFGMGGVGSEAGFLKVAGALGFPGLLLFLGWFLGVVWAAAAVVRAPNGLGQGLAILMLVCLSGYLLNSLTVPPDQSLFLAYLVPWLGGMTVSRWARLQALQAA
jgi:O-antigen ligase